MQRRSVCLPKLTPKHSRLPFSHQQVTSRVVINAVVLWALDSLPDLPERFQRLLGTGTANDDDDDGGGGGDDGRPSDGWDEADANRRPSRLSRNRGGSSSSSGYVGGGGGGGPSGEPTIRFKTLIDTDGY